MYSTAASNPNGQGEPVPFCESLQYWGGLAEALGFASGWLLLLPALKINTIDREIDAVIRSTSETDLSNQIAKVAKQRAEMWRPSHAKMLQWGAILFLLSFGLKFAQYGFSLTACPTPPPAVVPAESAASGR